MSKGLILVTGGAGFIGSHTVGELSDAGYPVRVLDSRTTSVHAGDGRWPDWMPSDVECMIGDVRNREDSEGAARCGGGHPSRGVSGLLPHFAHFFHVNSVGTALLYELIVAERVPVKKVVVASSQFVYGEGRYRYETDGE